MNDVLETKDAIMLLFVDDLNNRLIKTGTCKFKCGDLMIHGTRKDGISKFSYRFNNEPWIDNIQNMDNVSFLIPIDEYLLVTLISMYGIQFE
jgi:hypothetical protein